MYYERHILPIDRDGGFLLAVHYPQYRIGGDITRESANAYFAYGNINNLSELTDITSLCCPPRTESLGSGLS